MATFTAPLVTATFGALDRNDQGVASGVNNAMGQLAGLLAIAILPAVAGLSGVPVSSPEFAAGHTTALRIASGLAATSTILAAMSFAALRVRRGKMRT